MRGFLYAGFFINDKKALRMRGFFINDKKALRMRGFFIFLYSGQKKKEHDNAETYQKMKKGGKEI